MFKHKNKTERKKLIRINFDRIKQFAKHLDKKQVPAICIAVIVICIAALVRINVSKHFVIKFENITTDEPPTYQWHYHTNPKVEKNQDVIEAFNVKTTENCDYSVVTLKNVPEVAEEESVSVYGLKDGKIDKCVLTNAKNGDKCYIGLFDYDGFALVKEKPSVHVEKQTINAKASDDVGFSFVGYMPDKTDLSIRRVKEKAKESIYAYDIKVFDGKGEVFQPTVGKPLVVTIKSSEFRKYQNKILDAVHIDENGHVEYATIVSQGKNHISFVAQHFSEYVIRVHDTDTGLPVTPRRTYHFLSYEFTERDEGGVTIYSSRDFEFYNTAGDIQTTQIIKNKDSLELIPIPPHREGKYFYGWYIAEVVSSEDGVTEYKWGDNPQRVEFNKPITVSETDDTDIYVAPIYSNYRFVTFHENEEDQTNGKNVLTRKMVALGDDLVQYVKISDVRAQPPDAQRIVFWGWRYGDTVEQTVAADGSEIEKTISITETNSEDHLYPIFKQARWLTFVAGPSGSGAKYVPARFVIQGESEDSLPVSTRTGYRFDGWFTEETGGIQVSDADGNIVSGNHDLGEGNEISGGQLTLHENLKLYAHWTEIATADYVVVFWKQKVTDDKNATDKTYDYDTTVTRSGPSGTDITSSAADRSKSTGDYTCFTYSKTTVNNDGKIKSDGTTVINVYYDRDLMTINFNFRSADTGLPAGVQEEYTYTATTGTSTPQYGRVGGEYVQLDRESTTVYILSRNNYGTTEYTGTIYDANSNVVTNPVYPTTYYRSTGGRNQLYWRPTTAYIWSYNGEEYTGTRYTRSSSTSKMLVWTGLYGQTFAQNGYEWETVSGFRWNEQSGGGGTTQTMLDGFVQTSNPYNLYSQGTFSTANYIYHYKQNLDGTYSLENRVAAKTTNSTVNFNLSNKFPGFTVSSYSTGSSGFSPSGGSTTAAPGGKITSGSYPLHIYHSRNKYSVTINYNYIGGPADYTINNIPFEAKLSDYINKNAGYYKPSREHFNFLGWYQADKGDASDPPDFDLNATMPAANVVAYAHWDPIWYRVEIDPNGAEIDHVNGTDHGSTYFWLAYGTSVGQYQGIGRSYVPDDNGDYVYLNIVFDNENGGNGINANLRNALYIPYQADGDYHDYYNNTDFAGYTYAGSGLSYDAFKACISEQRYRPIMGNESYTLMGWYKVLPNGSLASTPYSFSDEIDTDVKLRAVWKRSELYYLAYNPIMTGLTGVGGTITQYIDPLEASGEGGKFTDQATAIALAGPDNITPGYKFQGWRIVDGTGHPKQGNTVIDPGEEFTVDSQFADSDGCVHMEAFYEPENNLTLRRVSIASLILDANGGTVNSKGLESGSTYVYADTGDNTLHLDKQQNNIKLDLIDYYKNFEHDDGHVLLGWNKTTDAGNYIPDYYADIQLGIDKKDVTTLYAVWEPTVYITFDNQTVDTLEFNISFSNYGGTVYTGHINEVTSRFEREEYTGTRIVLAPGESIKFVLPEGDGATYNFNGSYTGSKDKLYVYNDTYGSTAYNKYDSYAGTGTMITDKTGRVITFYDEEFITPAPTAVNSSNAPTFMLMALISLSGAVLVLHLGRKRLLHRKRCDNKTTNL